MPVSADFRPITVLPAEVFAENLTTHTAQEQHYARRHQLGGWLRVLLFGGGAAGAWWLFSSGFVLPGLAFVVGVLLAFWGMVRWHAAVGYQREHHRLLAQLNQQELDRLAGKLGGFDAGLRYLDAQHPYAADLDVFGAHSLFQLLNRASTRLGHDWLAGWLLRPALADEVRARQQAAAALAPDLAWTQEWQARARHFPRQHEADPREFSAWLARPDFFQDKAWLKPLLVLLPLLVLASAAAWGLGQGYFWLIGVQVIVSLLNGRLADARNEYAAQALAMHDALRATQAQLALFEDEAAPDWQAPRLRELRATLRAASHGTAATRRLGQLTTVAGLFRGREHPLGALLLNNFLLWDLHAMWQLERWKQHLGPELTTVLEVQAELEALVSLAGWQFANPTYITPELSAGPLAVAAEALGHPLIFAAQRITNDYQTIGYGQTAVITGSNMAGKSTFLRTVGLNMVLALAGGVVCARHLRLSPAQLFSAMRTQDNLAESTSSFYAELKRLKLLLDMSSSELRIKNEELKMTREPAGASFSVPNQEQNLSPKPQVLSPEPESLPVFYLLDEILKGTNSLDRHRGARALLRQLHQRRAAGLISTHDLELAALESEWPGQVRNFSFNSTFSEGEIHFDYHLTPGACQAFNASQLMQLMGIEVE
ncbi:MutS-related protein [Hymenobacter canadensis]|uniref:DNA mismatch repair protein MutS n=1 Tax=Hymenobacter canadensis TaxID=2999067 RepID=A0ABY7LJ80_9BACT|nr:DNA mismatch repair protein MutS [Hymenobacter canadensis]WBA40504.1 DNA mismatch repair protein MutS [Hymenobacter canadensis]